MELYIDGRQLHIVKSDISLNWTNIRFDDIVADEWSTELELANDAWNIDLLDCYGLLDRGPLYNHKVECAVMVDPVARDGYIQILSIEESIIKARVFIIMFPFAVLDRKVSDYYPHDDVVYRWDRFSPILTNIAGADTGIIPYTYTATDFYSNIIAQWHSSASIASIINLIQTAEDITLPAVSNTLWELSARKKVCPSNPFQVFQGNYLHSNAVTDKNLELSGGQHITNDFVSSWSYADFHWDGTWSDWLIESTNEKWMSQAKTMSEITFNRDCVAHIKIYACASHIGGILIPKKNGTSLAPAPASAVTVLGQNPNWQLSDILLFDDYVSFSDGDVFTLHYSGSAQTPRRNVRYTMIIEYEGYDWDENDYDVDLEYIAAPFGVWGIRDLGSDWAYDFRNDTAGLGDGTHSDLDYSYSYFGVYTNLDREMTVREFISNLAWIHNMKLWLDYNELIFRAARVATPIEANLVSIEPSCEKLGQTNIIGYRDAEEPLKFTIDNEFLEDEVVLHESRFWTGDPVPQYSYEMTYNTNNSSGNQWITDIDVKFEDLSPVIMTANNEDNRYWLRKAPEIQGLGLPELKNATQVTWQTMDRVFDSDYVYVDGHKYMVISGEEDVETGITEIATIQCDSDTSSFTPAEVKYTFKGGVTYPTDSYDKVTVDISVSYGSATFTQCGIELCKDRFFTGNIIRDIAYSDSYRGNITGLDEDTTYYYRYFAESVEFGRSYDRSASYIFHTQYAPPVLSITVDNRTTTTADVTLLYTGNYPFDNANSKCFIDRHDCTGTTITLNLDRMSAGVPEVFHLSGLDRGTLYDIEFVVPYYGGEISEFGSFQTRSQDL